jgi:hypothetical protein
MRGCGLLASFRTSTNTLGADGSDDTRSSGGRKASMTLATSAADAFFASFTDTHSVWPSRTSTLRSADSHATVTYTVDYRIW